MFNKPEYFFQPFQVFRKIAALLQPHDYRKIKIKLPWGTDLFINRQFEIGNAIYTLGVYDLSMTDSIVKIIQKGDTVLDIGANIGYTTNLMAVLTGNPGKVYAFEPHPDILDTYLKDNIALLQTAGFQNVSLFPIALSDTQGTGTLHIPRGFDKNIGIASLEKDAEHMEEIAITLDTLDHVLQAVLQNNQPIRLMKIDVEGHEMAVFKGAETLLKAKLISHIIFEGHEKYKNEVIDALKHYGYTIFKINKGFSSVILSEVEETRYETPYEPPNFLATLDPDYIQAAFAKKEWGFLKIKKVR